MKTISQQLVEASGGILHFEPEPSDSRYVMTDAGSAETEVCEFLFGLVRMIKPSFILETGTHLGVCSAYLGEACRFNGFGKVVTLEFIDENYETAKKLLTKLFLMDSWVSPLFMDAAEYEPLTEIDLLFLDTEPQTRFAELLKFFPFVKLGGFILIHDLHAHMGQVPNEEHGENWPFGKIPLALQEYVKQDWLRVVHFNNPRGLTLFYKTGDGDYRWNK